MMSYSLSFLNNDSFQMYNRNVARHCKSVAAAIILSELVQRYEYHLDRNEVVFHEKYGEGWFCFTVNECEENTCLSRKEQDNAIKSLNEKKLIEIVSFGLPAKRHFKLNEQKIIELFGGL